MTIYCQRCGRNLAADERKSALGYTLCPACIRDFNDAPDMPTWGQYARWVQDGPKKEDERCALNATRIEMAVRGPSF